MADNQADDDDDESFGDFKFVSFPNQPFASNQINGRDFSADDDEWGDFINHSNQINGGLAHPPNGLFAFNLTSKPSEISQPFDLFEVSLDRTEKNISHVDEISQVELAPSPAEPEKPRWAKPHGALPLSIFGEEEEPAEGHLPFADVANAFSNKNSVSVKKGSDSNGAIGINDLIANWYNQRPQMNSNNGSISILSGSDLNLSGASSNGISSISTVAAPNPDANGLNSNRSNLNSDLVDGNEDTGDDDDGWEFKCAEPEIQIKNENIKVEKTMHETTKGSEYTFRFNNGALDVGNILDSSSGISHKAGQWNLGFEFSPSSAVQDHISPRLCQKSELNDTKTGYTIFNKNFGELMIAPSESGSNHNLEGTKLAAVYPVSAEILRIDGEGPHGPDDPSLASESRQCDEWDYDFNFDPSSLGKDNHISESYPKGKQDDNNKNFNASPANSNVDYDFNLFESKDAVTEIGTDHEMSQISSENRREALPLSMFGDEMPDTDVQSMLQDFSPYAPTSSISNSFNSPVSNLSINDLIWNLYAEHNTSHHHTPKASENGIHATHAVLDSNLVTSDDDFNDESWEFKEAPHGTEFGHEFVQNTSNHAPQVSEEGLQYFPMVLNSDLTNGDDGFEDGSWEFKDAFCRVRSQYQASDIDHRDLPTQSSTKLESTDYVDFYCKLKDELCNGVLFHLQNLKNDQSVAALSGDDAKARALHEEIQEFSGILHLYNIFPNEYLSENHSTRNMYLGELVTVLKEPKFQSLESEYQLTSRLSMAEMNMRSAIELLKDAVSKLRILKLGSREEQSTYVAMWSKIAFVCSQELKHGAFIWKQSVQKNVHDQILSNPKGFQYIHALGEIYRVAEIIGASAKLHKPWMLSGSVDPANLLVLLNECYAIWSGSGLEEALFSISNQTNLEQDGISRELLESIKYIHELDEHALQSCVITGEETTCQLSALPADFIPGLKMVTWNGKHYFLTLANLWVNLVSADHPKE